MLPLEGLTVVALEQAVAAPFATRQLADLGARVIKIERLEVGDFARGYDTAVRGASSHFVWLNRSKESLTLNIKDPDAAQILNGLLSRADVFIQNLAPGAAERVGLGAAALHSAYPSLILCSICGYGSSGPYQYKKAYDLLVQAEAGVLSITGTPQHPAKAGISIADIAGGMYAYSGILTALITRGRTGRGSILEVSLFDALAEWMGYAAYYSMFSGESPQRSGANHAVIAPYGPFDVGDGTVVYLAVQNEREWERFCEAVLQRPSLATEPRFATNTMRLQHREALREIITRTFLTLTLADVTRLLDDAQIANGQMKTIQQFLEHPQLTSRGRWRTVDSPVGILPALIPPVSMTDTEAVMNPIPALGEHTTAILAELGFDQATIEGWRARGVV
jgi:crotonobetainyl-CoA:carnitine CoA-transferase CaiB-like acyl-CoA transferase